ncbi:MAG: ABC transporter permease subunit, partial [Actinomycetota bacterium]
IAEIVRGSILAVPKGQNEASNALALNGFQRYRFVVLPQAFRIAVPPIINQFLNLTKNSSLAIAVAYPDITGLIKTAIGNGNPATQLIFVLMACYLLFSLTISFLLNIVNRRLQLVGR